MALRISVALLSCFVLIHQVFAVDETLQSGAKGAVVVETVCSKIESVCLFPDSKMMLRRIAFVETNDGLDTDTYASGYYGGIWKVDEQAFLATKQINSTMFAHIQSQFNIDWHQVTWQDLTKPFYSGLAARLYLYIKAADVPRPVNDQANLWATKYRPNGQAANYVNKVAQLQNTCKGVADVTFIVDGSGSIGYTNFLQVKSFLKNVTRSLNIGPDPKYNTRVSVLQFSSINHLEFDLDDYSTLSDYENAIDNIQYMGQGTQTDEALDYLAQKAFLSSAGARGNDVPKIGIVMTDGVSNDYAKTIASAANVHANKITVFAIGIGSNINDAELEAIATDPDCKHLFYLNNFAEFESLVEAIEKKTCGAPVVVTNTTVIHLPINGTKNCQVVVGPNGLVVEIIGQGQTTIYFSNITFPTLSYYDVKYDVTVYTPITVFFPKGVDGIDYTMYCYIVNNPCKDSILTIDPVDTYSDPCVPDPCPCGYNCVRKPQSTFNCVKDGTSTETTTTKVITTTTPSIYYNCGSNNPCIPANAALNKFYFQHQDSTKFVQCGEWGQCFVMSCPAGLHWNQNVLVCT